MLQLILTLSVTRENARSALCQSISLDSEEKYPTGRVYLTRSRTGGALTFAS